MATRTEGSTLVGMTDPGGTDVSGDEIRQRRTRLGLSKARLADRAEVSVDTLRDWENGATNPHDTTKARILRVLDDLDEETGFDEEPVPGADPAVVRYVVRGIKGIEALVVEGPVENIAELEASAERIVRRLAADDSDS